MKIERAKLVAMFAGLGITAAEKWGDKRMQTKLAALPVYIDENKDMVAGLDEETDAILKEVLEAVERDEEIDIVLVPVTEGKKKVKKEKPAPVEEEDEVEEEESEEEPAEDEPEDEEPEPVEKPAKAKKPKKAKVDKGFEEQVASDVAADVEESEKKVKKSKFAVDDWVHVANAEEDEEWDGQVEEVHKDYCTVKDFDGDSWEEPVGAMTKLKKPPKQPARAKKPTQGKKEDKKKKSGEKKIGVIATIIGLLQKASPKKPLTKAEILKVLVEQFPERTEESMKTTISVQVPSKINREREGLTVKKNDKGYWIEG